MFIKRKSLTSPVPISTGYSDFSVKRGEINVGEGKLTKRYIDLFSNNCV